MQCYATCPRACILFQCYATAPEGLHFVSVLCNVPRCSWAEDFRARGRYHARGRYQCRQSCITKSPVCRCSVVQVCDVYVLCHVFVNARRGAAAGGRRGGGRQVGRQARREATGPHLAQQSRIWERTQQNAIRERNLGSGKLACVARMVECLLRAVMQAVLSAMCTPAGRPWLIRTAVSSSFRRYAQVRMRFCVCHVVLQNVLCCMILWQCSLCSVVRVTGVVWAFGGQY